MNNIGTSPRRIRRVFLYWKTRCKIIIELTVSSSFSLLSCSCIPIQIDCCAETRSTEDIFILRAEQVGRKLYIVCVRVYIYIRNGKGPCVWEREPNLDCFHFIHNVYGVVRPPQLLLISIYTYTLAEVIIGYI